MEHEKPPGEQLPSPEIEAIVPIDRLPEHLGYVETAELIELRGELTELMRAGAVEEVRSAAAAYHELGEELVNQRQGDEFPRAQIGLSVAMALIRRDGGRTEDCLEDMAEAWEYASHMGYDDIALSLEAALTEAVDDSD